MAPPRLRSLAKLNDMLHIDPARLAAPCLLALLASFQSVPAGPQASLGAQRKVRIIATTSTQMPGQTFDFTGFYNVCIDGERLSFNGGNFLFADGVYYWEAGQLSRVVDSTMDIPTLPPGEPFVGFTGSSLDGDKVAFLGARNAGTLDYEGLYIWRAGNMAPVVEKFDPVPDLPGGVYWFLFPPSMSHGEVIWNGYVASPGPDWRAIHSNQGSGNHVVVDTTDLIPGTGSPFGDFNFNPTVDSVVAFAGADILGDFTGVFAHDSSLPAGQQTYVVADRTMAVPDSHQFFETFYDGVTTRGDHFVFRARSSTLIGVYSTAGGLHAVADTNRLIPGRNVPFTGFDQWSDQGPAMDTNGDVAFVGEGPGGLRGIYVERAGVLRKVVETGDAFGAKTVSLVQVGREGLDGGVLGLTLGFTDGSIAVVAWAL